ncbi:hypothetical protein CAPN002_16580 [Capnocytophaga stomatis]|nr:hypothetical protein CAPN002_16580 [Capnocytophaga stomatis]
MLRKLRKKHIKNVNDIDMFLNGKRNAKYYIENNFKDIKLFRYLLFLRKNGADLNSFFDSNLSLLDKISLEEKNPNR